MMEAARKIRRIARTIADSPKRIGEMYRNRYNTYQFDHVFTQYKQLSVSEMPPDGMIENLVEYWANSWSAKEEYIIGLLTHLNETTGPVVECGSGITTLLLGHRCQQLNRKLWTLEHHAGWATRMRSLMLKHGLEQTVCIVDAPFFASDHFTWYDTRGLIENEPFNMVICDGPPGHTQGGRYGLLPMLGHRLADGCRILLDDASRPGEQEVLTRWEAEYGMTFEMYGNLKPYAVAVKS
jgi:hypothetical protein